MKAPTQALLPPVAHAVIRQPLGQCFALGIWIGPATREAPDVHHRGYARVVQELAEILAGQPPVSHSQQRSEEHTSELQSRGHLVCRLLLEKKNEDAMSQRDR